MLNDIKFKFNTEQECIDDYLTEYIKQPNEELQTWYNSVRGQKNFCIRIEGTKGIDTLEVYKVTKTGKYLK